MKWPRWGGRGGLLLALMCCFAASELKGVVAVDEKVVSGGESPISDPASAAEAYWANGSQAHPAALQSLEDYLTSASDTEIDDFLGLVATARTQSAFDNPEAVRSVYLGVLDSQKNRDYSFMRKVLDYLSDVRWPSEAKAARQKDRIMAYFFVEGLDPALNENDLRFVTDFQSEVPEVTSPLFLATTLRQIYKGQNGKLEIFEDIFLSDPRILLKRDTNGLDVLMHMLLSAPGLSSPPANMRRISSLRDIWEECHHKPKRTARQIKEIIGLEPSRDGQQLSSTSSSESVPGGDDALIRQIWTKIWQGQDKQPNLFSGWCAKDFLREFDPYLLEIYEKAIASQKAPLTEAEEVVPSATWLSECPERIFASEMLDLQAHLRRQVNENPGRPLTAMRNMSNISKDCPTTFVDVDEFGMSFVKFPNSPSGPYAPGTPEYVALQILEGDLTKQKQTASR